MLIRHQSSPWISLCTNKMQAMDTSCFCRTVRPPCARKAAALHILSGLESFPNSTCVKKINSSSHASLMSRRFGSTSWLGPDHLNHLPVHVKVVQKAVCKTEHIELDSKRDHLKLLEKEQKLNGKKSSKNKVTSIQYSAPDRLRLEQLGVDESALSKYMRQMSENISVDHAITCITTLMEITGIEGSMINTVLYKFPSLLSEDMSMFQSSVAFFLELGLEKEDILHILVHHPRAACCDLQELRLSVNYLLSIGLSAEDISTVLKKRPQALNAKAEDVRYTIECLLEFNVLLKDLTRLMTKVPDLFSPSMRMNMRPRLEFLKQVGLYGGALGKGIARRPNLLQFDLDCMKQAFEYLSGYLSSADVSRLVRRFAEVLLIDPERKMEPMVNYLLKLGVKPDNLGKVLVRRPQLLGYTIGGLEPTLQYLRELGVTDQLLARIVTQAPQVLTLNCEERLKPVIEYLHDIGLREKKDLERLLVRNAQLLCYSIEKNITPKINFFVGIGLDRTEVIKILVLFPSMFGQNIESTLEPKYKYLVDVMKRSPKDIIDFPQYFGYSLEKRIKPRFEKLTDRGITNVSLPSMLACVESDFVSRYLTGEPPSRGPYNV